ncbi:hypothetical protein [Tenacibaculum finnmarkense]|uniref:hypothetical protein n=1 Tax=Tenacibaculum finnmarkense TaxID=2781243 RepID=UPI001E6410D8|nr:hypothetical protein [Tenacibaculum finnmarkense]MCD8443305.1 hypothetical protein [Tenacibaculum finnmarkense genomovar ulcerans]
MKKYIYIIAFILPLFLKAQTKKDTLFIKYDFELLSRNQDHVTKEYYYLIKDKDNNSGYMYFLEKKIHIDLSTNSKIYCLEKMLRKSKAFYKKGRINFWKFLVYLYKKNNNNKSKVFLIKKNSFIEVEVVEEIE